MITESFVVFAESRTRPRRVSRWCARGDLNSHGLPVFLKPHLRLEAEMLPFRVPKPLESPIPIPEFKIKIATEPVL